MARYHFDLPRLFVEAPLGAGARAPLDPAQHNYLRNALRLKDGAQILAFNGADGEWRASLEADGRRASALVALDQTRAQTQRPDLHYLFAPLKHARLDYMIQKAVEMGAGALAPMLTRRTQAERVNLARMRANAIEAAEQCGILSIPEISVPQRLEDILAGWDGARLLIFCDEDAPVQDPVAALRLRRLDGAAGLAVAIGPEGGFDEEERRALLALPYAVRLSLGPRILRADTAAVAALAIAQAALGDWLEDRAAADADPDQGGGAAQPRSSR